MVFIVSLLPFGIYHQRWYSLYMNLQRATVFQQTGLLYQTWSTNIKEKTKKRGYVAAGLGVVRSSEL